MLVVSLRSLSALCVTVRRHNVKKEKRKGCIELFSIFFCNTLEQTWVTTQYVCLYCSLVFHLLFFLDQSLPLHTTFLITHYWRRLFPGPHRNS